MGKKFLQVLDIKRNGNKLVINFPTGGDTIDGIYLYCQSSDGAATGVAYGYLRQYVSLAQLQVNGEDIRQIYPQLMANFAANAVLTRDPYINRTVICDAPSLANFAGVEANPGNLFYIPFAELQRVYENEIYGGSFGTADPQLKTLQLVLTLTAIGAASTTNFTCFIDASAVQRPTGVVLCNNVTFPTTIVGKNTVEIVIPTGPGGLPVNVAGIYLTPSNLLVDANTVFGNDVRFKVGNEYINDQTSRFALYDKFNAAQFAEQNSPGNGIALFSGFAPAVVAMPFGLVSVTNSLVIQNREKVYCEFTKLTGEEITVVVDYYKPLFSQPAK